MTPMTREWVKKAEGDYDVITALSRSRKQSRHDPVCFHAQQCVEKYLKGRLNEAGVPFTKTHELSLLLKIALGVEPNWSKFAAALRALERWAVLPRYPGLDADARASKVAVNTCRRFRKAARLSLGLRP